MKRKWHRFVRSLGLALAVAAVMVPTAAANVPGESGDSRPAAAA